MGAASSNPRHSACCVWLARYCAGPHDFDEEEEETVIDEEEVLLPREKLYLLK